VKQKSGLNCAILDQGWGELRRQLDYEVTWNGGMLLAVSAHNTSALARAAFMYRKTIGKHKRNSGASIAVTKITPLQSGSSMKQELTEATAQITA
jgi:hypothetical protein